MSHDAGYVNMPTDETLVGKTGTVITPLRPAGIIEVDGRRLDVTADGAFVASGATVRVISVSGSFITVEKAEALPA
jgi:membrane-bound serine protease (ClpP class)